MTTVPLGAEWQLATTKSYRCGFVESETRERNAYLLQDAADDPSEYERGFADGLAYWWPEEVSK